MKELFNRIVGLAPDVLTSWQSMGLMWILMFVHTCMMLQTGHH